jgi:transposase
MDDQTTALVHPGGRPSKAEQLLTPEMLEQIARLLLEGNFKETVADFLGVDRKTWWNWEQRGQREPNSIYEEFFHVVKRASAGAEIALLRSIRHGAPGWQSNAWVAERRFPQRWGKRVEITVRREAERLAGELGCTADELIADAERIAAGMSGGR